MVHHRGRSVSSNEDDDHHNYVGGLGGGTTGGDYNGAVDPPSFNLVPGISGGKRKAKAITSVARNAAGACCSQRSRGRATTTVRKRKRASGCFGPGIIMLDGFTDHVQERSIHDIKDVVVEEQFLLVVQGGRVVSNIFIDT